MVAFSWKRVSRVLLVGVVLLLLGCGAGCAVLTQPVRRAPRTGPPLAADAARLEADVRALAVPRDWHSPEALERTATTLSERLKALGYAPQDQAFRVQERVFRNVTALLGEPGEPRLVVGAHYDSCDPLPGADDNASGVAVVLELARLLKQHPPRGSVELVFWTLEEPPYFRTEHMGSAHHADALAKAGVTVTAALAVETVGYFRDEEGSQHFPSAAIGSLYPSTGNFIALVSNLDNTALVRTVKRAMRSTGGIPVHSLNAPGLIEGIDWSDHR
jgi:hypothetical protein